MEDNNRVTVKIYGQEYTIAGSSSGDQIVVVASHVDKMMTELAKGMPSIPASSLAVLTAVNIANDYFDAKNRITELDGIIANLKKDADHYIQLWEDAKASFKQYKEDAQNSVEQLQELQRIFNMKNVELNKANEQLEALREEHDALTDSLEKEKGKVQESQKYASEYNELRSKYEASLADISQLKAKVQQAEESQNSQDEDVTETLQKYKELESSFFDIQMENIHLKNELDSLKKSGM